MLTTLPPLLLIIVFGVSAVGKLSDLRSARQTLRALRLDLPAARTSVATVAAVEVLVAAGLAGGARETYAAAAVAGLAATLGFLAVAVHAQRATSTDECGCFGKVVATRVGPAMTARNAALAGLALLTLAGAITDPPSNALIAKVAADPSTTAALLACVIAIAVVGASLREGRPAPTPAAEPVVVPDAALLAPDGTVVVPRQHALRGRAQLLLFVRRGCASCEALIARGNRDFATVDAIDIRLIAAVGDGGSVPGGPVHADASGTFAEALGIPAQRPSGVLLTTSGELLLPYATGADETSTLIDTVLAALPGRRGTAPLARFARGEPVDDDRGDRDQQEEDPAPVPAAQEPEEEEEGERDEREDGCHGDPDGPAEGLLTGERIAEGIGIGLIGHCLPHGWSSRRRSDVAEPVYRG